MTNLLVENAAVAGEELAWQMGRPIRFGALEIRRGFQERAAFMIDAAEACLADVPGAVRPGFELFIRREPVGTVLVVAPWNYPYLTAVNAVVPALLAGNSVILKHSDQTMLCAERLTTAFIQAGGPPGVFQHMHGTHADVAAIIQDPRIGFVAFTGSVSGGKALLQAARTRFIDIGLELGGKDPAYVRADADLEYAIENLVDGALFNSGQSCCAVERIYVSRGLFDDFVEGAVAQAKRQVLGNPLDPSTTLGPMVRSAAADAVRDQIREALAKGARGLIDPEDFPEDFQRSAYLPPQILVDVDHDMRIMKEETFGPVVGIMAVDDDEEALRLMNDSPYGLTASIWTADKEAAKRLGDHLETGTVFLNRCDYVEPSLAWTGVKDSGRGCTLSTFGFNSFVRCKSFHLRVELEP